MKKSWEQRLWDGLFSHGDSVIDWGGLEYKDSTIRIYSSKERGYFFEVSSNDGVRFTRMSCKNIDTCISTAKWVVDGEV